MTRLRMLASRIGPDLVVLTGIGLVSVGFAQVSVAAGLIVLGVCLIASVRFGSS
jgi:hypothetical protein